MLNSTALHMTFDEFLAVLRPLFERDLVSRYPGEFTLTPTLPADGAVLRWWDGLPADHEPRGPQHAFSVLVRAYPNSNDRPSWIEARWAQAVGAVMAAVAPYLTR